jgi:hypothetical protein
MRVSRVNNAVVAPTITICLMWNNNLPNGLANPCQNNVLMSLDVPPLANYNLPGVGEHTLNFKSKFGSCRGQCPAGRASACHWQ